MVKIALLGAAGRMGKALAQLIAQRDDCEVVAGIDAYPDAAAPFPQFARLEEMDATPDVLIDFSHPEATSAALHYCAAKGLPCVVCTTGLPEETREKIKKTAEKTPVFYSANMSLGINLLVELVKRAQDVLPGFDIEIIEKHHHNKLDAPSGTAMLLADTMNEHADGRYHYVYNRQPLRQKRDTDEIGIHAVRGGSIVGEHDVLFAGPDEVVTLSHTAYSRDVFANGAISAALYLAGKQPGLYSMQNLVAEK